MRKLLAILVLSIAVAGCATQDPLTRAALGYKTAEQMNRVTSTALNMGKMSSADAQNVLTSTRSAAAGLGIGVSLHKGGQDALGTKVDSSVAILRALENYLMQKGVQ